MKKTEKLEKKKDLTDKRMKMEKIKHEEEDGK